MYFEGFEVTVHSDEEVGSSSRAVNKNKVIHRSLWNVYCLKFHLITVLRDTINTCYYLLDFANVIELLFLF